MKCNSNNGVLGNSIDIKVDPSNRDVEIRADVRVEEFMTKRLWGQIINCSGCPVPNTLIKLVKIITCGCRKEYLGIAHTVTDCEGFYQFDICSDEEACYKIIVNKAVTGDETVIETGGGNCNACSGNPSYDPCAIPKRHIVAYEPCDNTRYQSDCRCDQPMPCDNTRYHSEYYCEKPTSCDCVRCQSDCRCDKPMPCDCRKPQYEYQNNSPICSYCNYPKNQCICNSRQSCKNNYATYTR